MSSFGSPSPFFLAGKKAYEVERSLRFNDNDSAYLSKTLSSDGNRTTMTLSVWLKRGNLGEMMILDAYENDSNRTRLMIDAGNRMQFVTRLAGNTHSLILTAIQRDPSAWYHFVWAIDTTDSTASNRVKMYINGEQQTDFVAGASYPDQNEAMLINKDVLHTIGIGQDSSGLEVPFDGYLAEINFIDGFQYDPSYFGETDVATGQWNPKEYTGSYGSKGFYLNFSTDTFGADGSGNGNNFTPQNFALTDAVPDTPTNNFSTFSPLFAYTNGIAFSEGNLKATFGGSGNGFAPSTFALQSGKWYAECLPEYIGNGVGVGIGGTNINVNDWSTGTDVIAIDSGGSVVTNSSNTYPSTPSSSYTTSDIIGVALDITAGTVTFYKNNSQIYQTNLSNMSTGGNSDSIYFFVFADGSSATSARGVYNFGQDSSFVGNKTRQGNTDANGKGDFYYAPPSGHLAACSANLPDPTIRLPNKHFDTLLYTGNGSTTQNITGYNFQPDWVWIKSRSSGSGHHSLVDSVRGDIALNSSRTNAEYSVSAFNFNATSIDVPYYANDYSMNTNSATYVAWNWNAGDTDGKTYAVTVVSDSGNKYRFDGFGTSAVTLDLAEGGTYIFDQSHSSNAGHPLRFSTTSNGTHGGGTEYTTGVTTAGTPGQSGAYTQIVVAASAPTLYYYCTQHSGMGGQANTNTTLGSSNFDGTIQSTVKVNASAGFSIVSFTGNATSGATVGHGLGVAPRSFILKERGNTNNWPVYHAEIGNTKTLYLDLNNDSGGAFTGAWNNTSPTSNVFYLGNSNETNRSSGNFIVYCFSEVAGYSKFGSYTGNGSSDGPFVFTGFRPAWIMIKMSGYTGHWIIFDNKRDPFNYCDTRLFANLANADTGSYNVISMLSNGFKFENQYDGSWNRNNTQFVYLAFAESPFKNARAR